MSPVGALAQWMGRWNVSPSVESAFTVTNKEGPMAILPLELSTTVGRSVSSARRNGFLEFQERLLEEIAVAIVWLYGVNFMSNLFNKHIKPALFKGQDHLDPETAWDFKLKNNAQNVDLLPSERFTRNASDRQSLTKIKCIGALISVVLATSTAALLIPWLNKKKTELIVHYLDKKEKQQQQTVTSQWKISQDNSSPSLGSISGTTRSQPLPTTDPAKPFGKPVPALRFGLSGGNLLQQLGHAVQQTDYGSLLAVDGGLAAGRIKVYGDRSPYEGIEIAIRDIGSLYFYMYSTPHIMRLMATLLNPKMRTDVMLEPKVGRSLQHTIFQQLLLNHPQRKAKLPPDLIQLLQGQDSRALEIALGKPEIQAILSTMPIDSQEIKTTIQGAAHSVQPNLKQRMTQSWAVAERNHFMNLLQKEAHVYGVSQTLPELSKYFKQQPAVSSDALQSLLLQVRQGQGYYQGLTKAQQQNLEVALKQAFRHSVGSSCELSSVKNQTLLQQMAKHLPEAERSAFWDRSTIMARQDARDIANSTFRRLLNLGLTPSQKVLGNNSQSFIDLGKTMADWLEKANARQQSLGTVVQSAIQDLVNDLKYYQGHGTFQAVPERQTSIQHLTQRLEKATPREIPDILQGLSGQLQGFKPNIWHRIKSSYMGKSELPGQVDNLKALLSPEFHTGCADILKAHLPTGPTTTFDALASQNLEAYAKALSSLGKTARLDTPTQALLEYYQKSLLSLLDGQEGRLFTLYTSQASKLTQEKYHALISGGIQNDSQLLSEGLETAGRLRLHSRLYNSPKAKQKMASQITTWSNTLLNSVGNKPIQANQLAHEMLQFRRISQAGHIIARILAGGISMLGLGIFVPKIQYAITRKLTGKDEHPGIATLHHPDKHTHRWHRHHRPEEFYRQTIIQA